MAWPFNTDESNAETKPNPEAQPNKGVEKTPAEMIADSLAPLLESNRKMAERLEQIEQNTIKRPEPRHEAEPVSVLDDENAAFAQRIGPVMLRQLELEARIVKNDIKAEYAKAGYGDLWEQYESAINGVLDSTPVVTADGKPFRGNPEYIRNTVDMVFGREARKAGMQFGGKGKGFFLESATGGDGSTRVPVDDGLSDGQRKVFGRMKVPLEDAKKVMAKLKFVSA